MFIRFLNSLKLRLILISRQEFCAHKSVHVRENKTIAECVESTCETKQKSFNKQQNCRLWLVILTAVDPSQLPRLWSVLLPAVDVHFNQQASSLFGCLWDDQTLKPLPSTKISLGPREDIRRRVANNSVKVHGATSFSACLPIQKVNSE